MNESILAAGIGIAIFIILISILIAVFYLLNLQNLLKAIKDENRDVEPANVWLMFIPLFNIVYPFILVDVFDLLIKCSSTKLVILVYKFNLVFFPL